MRVWQPFQNFCGLQNFCVQNFFLQNDFLPADIGVANPYRTPLEPSKTKAEAPKVSSAAAWLILLYAGAASSWGAFIHGLDLAFNDMFGEPAPPFAIWYFVASALLGVIALAAGVVYFVRRREFAATIGGLVCAGITMAITSLPALFTIQGLLQELLRCWPTTWFLRQGF